MKVVEDAGDSANLKEGQIVSLENYVMKIHYWNVTIKMLL
jgi:hypothetical protein